MNGILGESAQAAYENQQVKVGLRETEYAKNISCRMDDLCRPSLDTFSVE